MAKVKYDVTGVDPGGDFAAIPPGLYTAEILEANEKESRNGNEMIELVLEVRKPKEHKGAKLWYYVLTDDDSVAFRLREFLEAVGVVKPGQKKAKGAFDPAGTVGTEVQARTKLGKAQDGVTDRAEVAKLLPLAAEDADDEDEDDDEMPDDYNDWDLNDLKEEVEERELEVEGKQTKKKLVAALEEDDEDENEDENEDDDSYEEDDEEKTDEEDDEDEEDEAPDYDEMSIADLKKLVKENDGDVSRISKKGRLKGAKLKSALAEWCEENAEDEDAPDYSEWDVADLKSELKKRKLSQSGKKNVLVKRLEKDDEDDDGEPF